MQSLPPDVAVYKRTREFSDASVPEGLRARHQTKAGVWGRIVVVHGQLLYRILEPRTEEHLLSAGLFGIIEPAVAHQVQLVGEVLFYVEFLRAAD